MNFILLNKTHILVLVVFRKFFRNIHCFIFFITEYKTFKFNLFSPKKGHLIIPSSILYYIRYNSWYSRIIILSTYIISCHNFILIHGNNKLFFVGKNKKKSPFWLMYFCNIKKSFFIINFLFHDFQLISIKSPQHNYIRKEWREISKKKSIKTRAKKGQG